ncbi:MAG: toxin-antitoxin system [Chlorobium sp.]|nr:MAG: toxin-antitoxin system [Chlorobium sp.]
MTQVIVCNIEDDINVLLKVRTTRHGWSMEEEVRQILCNAVSNVGQTRPGLGSSIAARFEGIGLTEPLTELHGNPIEPMGFGS